MRKLMCDRCGAEIKEQQTFERIRVEEIRRRNGVRSIIDPGEEVLDAETMDVCQKCSREMYRLLTVKTYVEVDAPGREDCTIRVAGCCEGCVYCRPSPEEGCYNCARAKRRCPETGRDCPWWEAEKEAQQ